MVDLFVKKSAKELLLQEIKKRKVMKTHEVIEWGLKNFSNRAERNMRCLAREGKVKRMSDYDKRMAYGNLKEDLWLING